MTVFFFIYMCISLILGMSLEYYRSTRTEDLTKDEIDVFSFMERRPLAFYLIFFTTSPILLVLAFILGILTYISEGRRK